jgi:hypothetical protein
MEAVVDQRVGVRTGNDVNRSAVPAVAAARTAARHTLFTPEGEAPAAAMSCCDVDIDFVNEHRIWSALDQIPRYSGGTMLIARRHQ